MDAQNLADPTSPHPASPQGEGQEAPLRRRWPRRIATTLFTLGVLVTANAMYARGPLHAVKSERGPRIGSDHLPIKITWCWSAVATTEP